MNWEGGLSPTCVGSTAQGEDALPLEPQDRGLLGQGPHGQLSSRAGNRDGGSSFE